MCAQGTEKSTVNSKKPPAGGFFNVQCGVCGVQ